MHGERVTEPRRHVLEILAKSKKPLSAYDVLAQLAKKIDNPKPPTAYRALDFLVAHGFAHRIESLNAYICCSENHRHNGAQYLICDSCGNVEEIHLCHIPEPLVNQAKDKKFSTELWNVELHGKCQKCF